MIIEQASQLAIQLIA